MTCSGSTSLPPFNAMSSRRNGDPAGDAHWIVPLSLAFVCELSSISGRRGMLPALHCPLHTGEGFMCNLVDHQLHRQRRPGVLSRH
jgi:hypothetical protein